MTRAVPERPPVVLLMGPTAAGKTDIAVRVASRLPVDIVSVDSAMVYRGMDIGTGKPSAEVLAAAPHRLVDVRDPERPYSAAEFRADAVREIADIHRAGRLPLLVGGTGLYFRVLRRGLARLPAADPVLRARLSEAAARLGWEALHARLARVDAAAAARIHPRDPQRIQRALEVHEITGRRLSELQAEAADVAFPYRCESIVLEPGERSWLHERIAMRFRGMIACGLLDELRDLRASRPLHPDLPSMRAVGYRQAWQHLDGVLDASGLESRGIAATRQLARRQLTWLRGESGVTRLRPEEGETARELERRVGALL